ncbi:hypothetical protein [Deinococcus apachensis]|uniref:hypothetical protein n=1 Tax=Deinococcus apachensis TaxID=309886 RepID=UPI0003731A53|nr:hypothetical protein [Deinococcus apachensis]
MTLNPQERYAIDTRTLLDLTAYELRRLGLPPGTPVAVHAAHSELREDLADRLEDQVRIVSGPQAEEASVHIYLWSLELQAGPPAFPPGARHVLVAFRNRLSHRSLVNRRFRGVWYPTLERQFRRAYRLRAGWGVLGPGRVAWLAASALANRARRYDLGYAWADRALLTPTERGWPRYACPQGLLVGSRA